MTESEAIRENCGVSMKEVEQMERLTNIGSNGEIWITDNDETRRFGRKESAYKKLAEYEDLEEQGLLLRLPLEAYFIKDNKMYKGWVQEVVYSVCRKLLLDIRYDDKSLDSYRGYLGNDVFLTKSEAEAKLKELRGGENESSN